MLGLGFYTCKIKAVEGKMGGKEEGKKKGRKRGREAGRQEAGELFSILGGSYSVPLPRKHYR